MLLETNYWCRKIVHLTFMIRIKPNTLVLDPKKLSQLKFKKLHYQSKNMISLIYGTNNTL